MRKTPATSIFIFVTLFFLTALTSLAASYGASLLLPEGSFRPLILVGLFLGFYLSFAISFYRLFLFFFPVTTGYLDKGTRPEMISYVVVLFYLVIFNSLIRSHIIPVPFLSALYRALGAKIGHNSYVAGVLLDPHLTQIGDNSIVGHGAVVFAHVIEGEDYELAPVKLGSSVTIGANSVIMPDVHIGDGAIVACGSVVSKGARIPAGETWGGVPAKKLK